MKKVSKSTVFMLLILIATTVSSTISLVNAVTANTKLRNEVKAYKAYYDNSEALFEEIEDYNENLFDTDKAINYYEAKNRLPVSK
jgi:peptidoglycan hydrolase CwlO-like protein